MNIKQLRTLQMSVETAEKEIKDVIRAFGASHKYYPNQQRIYNVNTRYDNRGVKGIELRFQGFDAVIPDEERPCKVFYHKVEQTLDELEADVQILNKIIIYLAKGVVLDD